MLCTVGDVRGPEKKILHEVYKFSYTQSTENKFSVISRKPI